MWFKLVLTFLAVSIVTCTSSISCNFGGSGKKENCGWRRTWEGMERSNWKHTVSYPRAGIEDIDGNGGYFLLFRPNKKFMTKRARIVSKSVTVDKQVCLSFWHFGHGSRYSFPRGMPRLNVIAKSLKGNRAQLFRWDVATGDQGWKFVEIQLDTAMSQLSTDHFKLEITATRGRKFKTAVGIDDIKVDKCSYFKVDFTDNKKDVDGNAAVSNMVKALPARRVVTEVHVSAFNFTNQEEPVFVPDDAHKVKTISKLPKRKSRRRKKKTRKSQNRTEKYGIVYLPDLSGNEDDGEVIQPQILCDFIKYTHRIQRCMRIFFMNMQERRSFSKRRCSEMYDTLENCVQRAAVSCVPELEVSEANIRRLITTTLNEDLKTKEVYCEEEGAFVYPDYSFAALHLRCDSNYFMKLSQCGTSFASLFNVEHGDPQLCKKYYNANECQRQTTAEECRFDVPTMIRYGLNLQYQFAHNPFCIKVPFSTWWPET